MTALQDQYGYNLVAGTPAITVHVRLVGMRTGQRHSLAEPTFPSQQEALEWIEKENKRCNKLIRYELGVAIVNLHPTVLELVDEPA